MELTLEFWYLLPISIIIATIAMSGGVGGAVFADLPIMKSYAEGAEL